MLTEAYFCLHQPARYDASVYRYPSEAASPLREHTAPFLTLQAPSFSLTLCVVSRTFIASEISETMARKKISTTVYITPEQNDQLKLLNHRTKVPIAVYIREGIDLVLERHAHLLPGQLTLDDTLPKE